MVLVKWAVIGLILMSLCLCGLQGQVNGGNRKRVSSRSKKKRKREQEKRRDRLVNSACFLLLTLLLITLVTVNALIKVERSQNELLQKNAEITATQKELEAYFQAFETRQKAEADITP